MGTGPQYTISQLNQDGVLEAVGPNNPLYISGGGGGGAVDSVNGKTGAVVLNSEDVGAVPSAEGQNYRVYGTDTSGVNTTFLLEGLNPLPVTVPMRTETGAVVTATPTEDNHAATKEYVDSKSVSAVESVNGQSGVVILEAADVGAVPDTMGSSSGSGNRIRSYANNGNLGVTYRADSSVTSNNIVVRNSNAHILVNTTPTENNHAASKQYVDLRVPVPPATGTYTLQSVDGVTSWVAVTP